MNSTQAAYFAGLVDGEGCISIWKTIRQRDKNTNRTPLFTMRVTVSMQEPAPAIYELDRVWKGYMVTNKNTVKKFGCKHGAMIVWSRDGKEAVAFLKELYPYLITKKAQAELAIKFQEELQKNRGQNQWRVGSHWTPRPQEVTDLYASYHEAMMDLNRPHRHDHPQRLNESPSVDTEEVIV